ncbi:LysR family transcriptional regulator [Paenibacillus sp. 7124]|uniref:LysR family transcriptional regulator n=1 Tax=Paenibacillus apii TaxID=1850370 RepID=A0A6M1PVV4_9BACL|nr:LysR family transcriptional regulator [Paenibacillus apii]NGM84301.1 LysR family transcriptional regulator [Paenibacillus apii]
MKLSQLQCFVALAELGSFTEAAYAVGLTQSAVSHALAALENEVGVTLLERNRKGVAALTDAGQKIIPHVRELLAQAEAIEQEAKSARGLAKGKLRLGGILSFSPGLLAGVLARFQKKYPDIEVVLFEGTIQEINDWITCSIIDVGFVLHPAKDVESTYITTDELCVLVPSRHRLHAQTEVSPQELCEEGFIMAKDGCSSQLMELAGLELKQFKPLTRYHANDSATLLAMVREGLGITLLPRMMLPKKLEGVVALPLNPPQMLQIGLAVRSQEIASPAAVLFVQTVLAWMQEVGEIS